MRQGASALGGSCRAVILILSFHPTHTSFLRDWFGFGISTVVDGSFLACRSPSEVFFFKLFKCGVQSIYILSIGDVLLKREQYLVAH